MKYCPAKIIQTFYKTVACLMRLYCNLIEQLFFDFRKTAMSGKKILFHEWKYLSLKKTKKTKQTWTELLVVFQCPVHFNRLSDFIRLVISKLRLMQILCRTKFDITLSRFLGCLPLTGANRLVYGLCKGQGKPSRMGNSVRDKHVLFVRFALIYIQSGTNLTIGVGLGTGRKK